MSKKFIILLLFAGVFVSVHKSFADKCKEIENKCITLSQDSMFRDFDKKKGSLFCRVFNTRPARRLDEKFITERESITQNCETLWNAGNMNFSEFCQKNVETMRKVEHCD